jgi:hypothetical protein
MEKIKLIQEEMWKKTRIVPFYKCQQRYDDIIAIYNDCLREINDYYIHESAKRDIHCCNKLLDMENRYRNKMNRYKSYKK